MFRRQLVASLMLSLSVSALGTGCHPPPRVTGTGTVPTAVGQTRQALGDPLPVTRTYELDPSVPLWPAGGGRPYAVITRSLEDSEAFVAYGVEVPANPSYDFAFLAAGSATLDLDAFVARVQAEGGTVLLFPEAPAGSGGSTGGSMSLMGGQIGNPPPTDPPGAWAGEIAADHDEESGP
jgi:hypothetical protein